MNIIFAARKTVIKDSFKEKSLKKLSKLERFFHDQVTAYITVTHIKDRETVEITIDHKGMFYRCEKTTGDRMESLDAVVDSLTKQIVKNKTKLEQHLRENAFSEAYIGLDAQEDIQLEDYSVVRTKKFTMKPMNLEEAVLQMNLIGHTFYMFINDVTDQINVVYKRKDGDYGLIEPEID